MPVDREAASPVVFPRLSGGLGNQLFQVATARAYARRTGRTLKLPRRVSGDRRTSYRQALFSTVPTLGLLEAHRSRALYAEPAFSYRQIPEFGAARVELRGYFQSASYFERSDVQRVLTPSTSLITAADALLHALRERAEGRPLVAVHVRRGDYLQKPDYHVVLPARYYARAVASTAEDALLALFSDDLPACRAEAILDASRVVPVDQPADVSLLVMAGCDHHIIANSSLSWWGAYLAAPRAGRVLAPSQWFGPLGPGDTDDLLPAGWEIVSCS